MVTPKDAIERVIALRSRTVNSRLLDRVRAVLRTQHATPGIEEAYAGWIRRFLLFHGMRRPAVMGSAEIKMFLVHLNVDCRLSAAMQNQAFGALLFLYREFLGTDVPWLEGLARARRPQPTPAVRMHVEVRAGLTQAGPGRCNRLASGL